ncbi:DUF3857 domain-containing protein [Flavobacterium alvei]|uniref:DUF3857 domain-containing protein n=1 Tax=Flavobacterium alvei TaxID=2080416 RepID=UPI0026F130B3|nr:DUF3857 domain-containing protein [Flavobacterium alvei]
MKTYFKALILFFVFFYSNAQEFKLGKVSIAELEEKEHPKDPSATAAILFKKGEVKFEYTSEYGFQVVTKVQTRIKIYKKEGYDFANQSVPYHLESSLNEKIAFSDAITYNLVSGKIEKTKLKSDGEFVEKVNKYWGRKKITMPNVKEGSVIEFEYTIKTGLIGSLRDWDFQLSIPVNYSEYTTYVPEYYTYKSNQTGGIVLKTTIEKNSRKVNYVYVQDNKDGTPPARSNEELNFIETKTSYSVKDLPAIKEEAFVNNIHNYTTSISNELSVVNYPNTPPKYYSTDWESVVKTIYDFDDFGPELNKTGYFEADVDKLLTGINTSNERIEALFNYVKSNVKWDDYKGYSCNEGVKNAYKNKTGNCAEINLMLTAMMRYAGLNANPVLISTRDNGIAFFPNRTAFNYVIAAVETPEGMILLDATEKYSKPNILPLRDLNWFGRLIRKDGTSTEINLMPKTLSRKVVNMGFAIKSDGSIEGKTRSQYVDYEALDFRIQHLLTNKDTYLEELENKNNKIEISDYARENDLDLSKPISEVFSFKDTKSVEIINDKIYISPLLFLAYKENPFKQEVREYPVDFGYPSVEKINVSIEIPEGYVVESLPAPLNIATAENVGSFVFNIASSANKIQTVVTSTINEAIVPSDFYPVLKGFYQQMIDKQNEKIVLKKI